MKMATSIMSGVETPTSAIRRLQIAKQLGGKLGLGGADDEEQTPGQLNTARTGAVIGSPPSVPPQSPPALGLGLGGPPGQTEIGQALGARPAPGRVMGLGTPPGQTGIGQSLDTSPQRILGPYTPPASGMYRMIMGSQLGPEQGSPLEGLQPGQSRSFINNQGLLGRASYPQPGPTGMMVDPIPRDPHHAGQPDLGYTPAMKLLYGNPNAAADAQRQRDATMNTMQAADQARSAMGLNANPARPLGTVFNPGGDPSRWRDYEALMGKSADAAARGDLGGTFSNYPGTWRGPAFAPANAEESARMRALGLGVDTGAAGQGLLVDNVGRPATTTQMAGVRSSPLESSQMGAKYLKKLGLKPGASVEDTIQARDAANTPRYADPDARRLMVTARVQGRPLSEPMALYQAIMNRGGTPTLDQRAAAVGPEAAVGMDKELSGQRLMASLLGTAITSGAAGAGGMNIGQMPAFVQQVRGAIGLEPNGDATRSYTPPPAVNPKTGTPEIHAGIARVTNDFPDLATNEASRQAALARLAAMGITTSDMDREYATRSFNYPATRWAAGRMNSPVDIAEARAKYRLLGLLLKKPTDLGI